MRSLALLAITAYQKYISPFKGFSCSYRVQTGHPGCSALGYRAIRRYGISKGMAVLRRRQYLCGVAHRRHRTVITRLGKQSGLCDIGCDLPCHVPCDVPCDLADVNCGKGISQSVGCCDCCSCDWPDRRKHKKSEEEKYVYLPPKVAKP